MAVYSDEGYIIKRRNFLESDLIVTVFTKNHGKIDAIVKSGRKVKSRKAGYIDYLNKLKFLFAEGKSLDIITEVEPIEIRELTKQEVDESFVFFTSEFLNLIFPENLESRDLYKEFELSLDWFLKTKEEKYLLYFMFYSLAYEGYTDFTRECVICEKTLQNAKKIYLYKSKGGFVDDCNKQIDGELVEVNIAIVKILLYFKEHKIVDIQSLNIKNANKLLLFKLISEIIEQIAEREIKSFYLLKKYYND
ncbi:DNA repair protein RecO [Candidatus Dojkabacteria bacterium]|uniref:DNA repair protein RecO n=1 Tax=Candidatus Dojkabacteria bacterium TaxID=2099670 RepID=A0A955L469_9BACT|nr:DNA repair protein RecO [Candidatus Dojkabacteria bacterium]